MRVGGRMKALLARTAEAAHRRSPHRELIIRANGEVAYVQLRHRRQLLWVGLGLLLTAWLAYSSVSYVIFDRRLAAKNVEIDRAVSAYRNLKHNLTDAERKYVDVTHDLEDKTIYLQHTLDENAALRRNLDAISSVLDSVVAQRTRIAGERQVLEQRTVSLETRLKNMQVAQAEGLGLLG